MSDVNTEPWSEKQIEEWEHNQWLEAQDQRLEVQEMGDDIYKSKEDNEEMEDDPFEEEERRRWQK